MSKDPQITSIIAHIDHGKTTMLDCLIASEGLFSKNLIGDILYLDSRKDEEKRGITLKLTPIKIRDGYLFIDTPGHVDFESLIFSSAILSDNHLILVDVVDGIQPRIHSLIKFIDPHRTILVLNKIDLCTDFEKIDLIIRQMNGLIGDEILAWEKNNILLSSTVLGCGLCYEKFSMSKKNSIRSAFKTMKLLQGKVDDENEIEILIKKYKIPYGNKKLIFSTVLPLVDCVYNTIDSLGKNENAIISSMKNLMASNFNFENNFYSIKSEKMPEVLAISVYGVFKQKNNYTKENVLFLTKILNGKIIKGQNLICKNEETTKQVTVEHIYEYYLGKFVEIEFADSNSLVYLEGDFLKNCLLSSISCDFILKNNLTPFYKTKIILKDSSKLNDIKSIIKTISYTEQNLKVRLNRFGELEFRCSGRIQFEKICFDLNIAEFDFEIKDSKMEFREFSRKFNSHLSVDSTIEIFIGPIDEFNEKNSILEKAFGPNFISNSIDRHDKNNKYAISSNEQAHIIESVLDIFTSSGAFINEPIMDTFIGIKTSEANSKNFFNILKKELNNCYIETDPSITPLYFDLKFSLAMSHLGDVYQVLQKHNYFMKSEYYNSETDFTILECMIPHFKFNSMVDEVRLKTKGAVYLEIIGEQYISEDFYFLADTVKKEKGIYYGEKIIEDPDKQRTFRK